MLRRAAQWVVLGAVAASVASDVAADEASDAFVAWHRTRALRLEAEGRRAEATEEWITVSRLADRDPDAAVRAAVAVAEFVTASGRRLGPKDAEYLGARELIAEAIRRGATNDPALAYAIGRIEFAVGDLASAVRMLGFARRRGFDPVRARLWHYRAVVADAGLAAESVDPARAAGRLEAVLRDHADHPDELSARIYLAIARRRLREYAAAEEVLADVIARWPWAARAHLLLGQVLGDTNRYDEAMAAFRTAMEKARERDDGLHTGQKILVEALLWSAGTELRRNRLDAAEVLARQYETVAKDSGDALFLLGTIAQRRGTPEDLDRALPLLRRAVRLSPERREFALGLHTALVSRGEVAEAAEVQRKIDAIDAARAAEWERFRPNR